MKLKRILTLVAVLLAVITLPRIALAHRILADSQVGGDGKVRIEAFFPDGTPARGGRVEIFLPGGEVFIDGTTGKDGFFFFNPKRQQGVWRAVVTGMMGHRAETEFEIATVSEDTARQEGKRGSTGDGLKKISVAHVEEIPWLKIISGLGFIFALASFIMVMKLRAELKRTKNASAGN